MRPYKGCKTRRRFTNDWGTQTQWPKLIVIYKIYRNEYRTYRFRATNLSCFRSSAVSKLVGIDCSEIYLSPMGRLFLRLPVSITLTRLPEGRLCRNRLSVSQGTVLLAALSAILLLLT